jgi:gamma-glutamyl-gamma-aminobutyrate hydrolase PuuD
VVQWKPEVAAAEDRTQQALLDALVAEASRRALGGVT